jgi:hypothetical protein
LFSSQKSKKLKKNKKIEIEIEIEPLGVWRYFGKRHEGMQEYRKVIRRPPLLQHGCEG